jgi:hypothetical protein
MDIHGTLKGKLLIGGEYIREKYRGCEDLEKPTQKVFSALLLASLNNIII